MSLYGVQKLLFKLNNDPATRKRYAAERDALFAEYALTDEERRAFVEADVGRLHLMGAHPLLKWPDYLAALKRAREQADA